MRTFTRLSTVMAMTVIATATMAKTIYIAADDSTETQICVSAAMDSPIRFYTSVRDSGYSLRSISNNVTCNDAVIGQFASSAGNSRNARSLMRVYNGEGHVEIRDEVSLDDRAGFDVASADRVVYIKGR